MFQYVNTIEGYLVRAMIGFDGKNFYAYNPAGKRMLVARGFFCDWFELE